MRRIETWIILLALAFYAWLLHRVGFRSVLENIRLVGWGLAITIALEAVARLANTIGWRVTILDCPRALSLSELFVARIGGEAVDYVTPSGQLSGQFVMALTVRSKLLMAVGLASVTVAALAEMMGQIGFITAATALTLPYESRLHHLIWPIMGGMAFAVGLTAAFFFVQLRKPFSHVWRALVRLDISHLANKHITESAQEADALLVDFYALHRRRFMLSCACYLFAWSLGPVEIFIYLHLLHQPVTWMMVLIIEALGQLLERATFLIPGKLVSQEGGKALILSELGYASRVGFTVGLLRRIKELVWVAFGLIGLSLHRLVSEAQPKAVISAIEFRKDARSA